MIARAAVRALLHRARQDVESGALPSCQVALGYEGEIVAAEAFGAADLATRYVTFSVSKAVVAGAAWLAVGDGLLDYATPVAAYVPAFGANGKDRVTVEQLLLHTAGFPSAPLSHEAAATRAGRLERFASWQLRWEPGTRCVYHPTAAHWVLREVLEAVTGAALPDVVAGRLAGPLGLPGLSLGLLPGAAPPAALQVRGEGLDGALLAQLSAEARDALAQVGPERLLRYNDPAVLALGVPGAGVLATAVDVAAYYQALLHDAGGLWDPQVLADGTAIVRARHPDPATRAPANRTRGLVVAGADGLGGLRGFGPAVGPRAFGSPGVGGQLGWADPDTGISFSYLTNGLEASPVAWFRRSMELSDSATSCFSATSDSST